MVYSLFSYQIRPAYGFNTLICARSCVHIEELTGMYPYRRGMSLRHEFALTRQIEQLGLVLKLKSRLI